MRQRTNDREREAVEGALKIELTPMIDVTFLILIFFMCTLKFKTLDERFESFLPSDKGMGPTKAEVPPEAAELQLRLVDPVSKGSRRIAWRRARSNEDFGVTTFTPAADASGPAGLTWDQPGARQAVIDWLSSVHAATETTTVKPEAKINARFDVPQAAVIEALDLVSKAGFKKISWSGIPSDLMRRLPR